MENICEMVMIHHGNDKLDKSIIIKPPYKDVCRKPFYGLWASPQIDGNVSVWTKWCNDNNFYNIACKKDDAIKFKIKDTARIFIIDCLDDLKKLIARFSTDGRFVDWKLVSDNYDVVYLTEDGQWGTRLTMPDLYGWDLESCVIFNYDVIEVL